MRSSHSYAIRSDMFLVFERLNNPILHPKIILKVHDDSTLFHVRIYFKIFFLFPIKYGFRLSLFVVPIIELTMQAVVNLERIPGIRSHNDININ